MADHSSLSHQESLRFRGLARVNLAALNFEYALSHGHRDPSERNVSRLVSIFHTQGCKRSETANFVKARVNEGLLDAALNAQLLHLPQQPPADWTGIPILPISSLDCLNGLHRIFAARRYLDQNDQWWIASLYTAGQSPSLRCMSNVNTSEHPRACSRHIVEEYSNEQAYSDGEIFRKIRLCHKHGDEDGERGWWARLSKDKKKDLRQFLSDEEFANACDAMLLWPGMFHSIPAGGLRRSVRMLKCREEQLNFLRLIFRTWSAFFTGTSKDFSPEAVDSITVRKLETLCPTASLSDAELIVNMINDYSVFPRVHNHADRTILRSNLLKCTMIPSFYTFFENLKHLEPCVKILRSLLPPNDARSLRRAFFASYFRPSELRVEYGMYDTRMHPSTSFERDREIGYQQLWLMALRNSVKPKLDAPKDRQARGADELTSQRLGALAVCVGFRSDAARELAAQDAETVLAAELVCRTTDGSANAEEAVQQIASTLRNIQWHPLNSSIVGFAGEDWLPRDRRCGKPFHKDYDHDRPGLFLPVLYTQTDRPSENVSTLYCKLETFRGFFGIENVPATTFDAPTADHENASLSLPASTARAVASDSRCAECIVLREKFQAVEAEKRSKDSQLSLLEIQLRETSHSVSCSQEEQDLLRSRLVRVEEDAGKSKAELDDLQKERSTILDELSKCTRELNAAHEEFSALLLIKDGLIQELKETLDQSASDLATAQASTREVQKSFDIHLAEMEELRAELHRLRDEVEQRAAANESLDDRLFDAGVALANDRRTFEDTLVEQSREAEMRLQHKDNILAEALAQIAKDREEYQLTISTMPDAGFRLLRVVNLEGRRICVRDKVISPQGAEELLAQLELADHDLSQYIFMISMSRRVMVMPTYSTVQEAWRMHQVLWVLPRSSFNDVRKMWSHSPGWDRVEELERHGFTLSQLDGKLQYSNPWLVARPLRSTIIETPSEEDVPRGRKRKGAAGSPLAETRRSRSPVTRRQAEDSKRERSPLPDRRTPDARTRLLHSPKRLGLQTPPGSQRRRNWSPKQVSHQRETRRLQLRIGEGSESGSDREADSAVVQDRCMKRNTIFPGMRREEQAAIGTSTDHRDTGCPGPHEGFIVRQSSSEAVWVTGDVDVESRDIENVQTAERIEEAMENEMDSDDL